jgi:hypothetical protein
MDDQASITPLKFQAIIEDAGNGGAFIRIPFDAQALYSKKRVKVKALIDGILYRGSLVRMGTDCEILSILKSIREKVGKSIGDKVEIVLEKDSEERVVQVPEDLTRSLANNPPAQTLFNKLSYTHKKEHVQWVEQAKRLETRQHRIKKTIDLLLKGIKAR